MSQGNGQSENKPSDRDSGGRFVPGSGGNKYGNPTTRRQAVRQKAMRLLLDELTKNDAAALHSIVEGWVKDAIEHQTARKYLLDRLLGMSADSETLAAIERIQRQVVKLASSKGGKS
jgi:hypothetical protein